eukprot:TRINITY_DN3075_c0_g2_i1.p1 TRINITY_DN3075_c0_g2~~TRINITY_DN3075_c0_g2_i1.p1  ORF type:complete len:221 (-),score=62.43 TRINITY_DN3075_c0_g2_i1:103-765(-)
MDSYGRKCNSKFLLHYGFTVESNFEVDGACSNEIELVLKRDKSDALQHVRQLNDSMTGSLTRNMSDTCTKKAFAYLRYAVATEQELNRLISLKYFGRNIEQQIVPCVSGDNELHVLQSLALLMEELLKQYPTTLEEDKKLLESGTLKAFSNRKNALVVVIGEKEIMHHYIALYKHGKTIFRMNHIEAQNFIRKRWVETEDDEEDDFERLVGQYFRSIFRV